jgi:hypothetical protein
MKVYDEKQDLTFQQDHSKVITTDQETAGHACPKFVQPRQRGTLDS